MKSLDPHSVVKELMSHYLQGKCYNSESFIKYVARDVRAHNDSFTTEDRAVCKKVAEDKIEEIVNSFESFPDVSYDHAALSCGEFNNGIIGEIDGYELELICNGSEEHFIQVARSGDFSERKELAKRLLTKAFIGK